MRLTALFAMALLVGCTSTTTSDTRCGNGNGCPAGLFCDSQSQTCRPDTPDLSVMDAGEAGDQGGLPDANPDQGPGCLTETECASGQACVSGRCGVCQTHGDCRSQVCDVYASSPSGSGVCVAESGVIYVDNRNGTCSGSHSGTRSDPVCTVAQGLALQTFSRNTIRILGSTQNYGPVTLSDSRARLFGPAGAGVSAVIGGDPTKDSLTIAGVSDVLVDGLTITTGRYGVYCFPAPNKLTLRRSRVEGAVNVGMYMGACSLAVDRSLFTGNRDGAMQIDSVPDYVITNNLIVRNTSAAYPAIRISGNSIGSFRFNTVADNITKSGAISLFGGINCGSLVDRELIDSIFVGNSQSGTTQFQNRCVAKNSVVGPSDSITSGIHLDAQFVAPATLDYRLIDNASNAASCIDKAQGTIATDYFGKQRPLGAASDIGAHELK